MNNWLHGCDVSHYQSDTRLPWLEIAKTSQFVIIKASDGVTKDPACLGHVEHARSLDLTVGLYHFFRDPIDAQAQVDTFSEVADACALGPEDMFPCIDIEDYPGHMIGPHTSEPASEWCLAMQNAHGGAIVYTSQRDWARMGGPIWMLAYPLWVAHYRGVESDGPATPDHRDWAIWQYAVHPYAPGQWANDAKSPLAIDHNWAKDPLPKIAQPGQPKADVGPGTQRDPTYLTDIDWAELRAARDREVADS